MTDPKVYRSHAVPAERELRMPDGTPLGMGILGAMKFDAIRRVLDHAARAATAKANLHNAEAAVAHALIGRERARNQLEHIDQILEEDTAQFEQGLEIARLRRRLEKIELEDEIAEREARRARMRAATGNANNSVSDGVSNDEFALFMADLKRLPELAQAVAAAKEAITKNAGGTDKLSEADKQLLEILDAMLQGFMAKRAGQTAL